MFRSLCSRTENLTEPSHDNYFRLAFSRSPGFVICPLLHERTLGFISYDRYRFIVDTQTQLQSQPANEDPFYLPDLAFLSFRFFPIRPPMLFPALSLPSAAAGASLLAEASPFLSPPVRLFLAGRSPAVSSPSSRFVRGFPLPLESLLGRSSFLTATAPSLSESSSLPRDLRLRSGAPPVAPPCRASPTFSTRRLTTFTCVWVRQYGGAGVKI
jgi:hypothetical protein